MIFLNLLRDNSAKVHSEDILQETNQLIEKMVKSFPSSQGSLQDFFAGFTAPLFDLYIKYNQDAFSAVSKALALDYSRNFEDLERDTSQSYRSRLILHCLIWQDSQAGVQELVSSGKAALKSQNGEATYHAFQRNADKNEQLKPVLDMVNAYLTAEICALLPILEKEDLIEISEQQWATLMDQYADSLETFKYYALEAQILDRSKYPQAIAI